MFLSVIVNVAPCEKTWTPAVPLLMLVSTRASTLRSGGLCSRVIVLPFIFTVPFPLIVKPAGPHLVNW